MSHEQYWEQDSTLVKYYRKAAEIAKERKNQELWLQGMYIYEAICDVSPILHSFAKKGTKPIPYPSEPYSLTEKERAKKKEDAEKAKYEKGRRIMEEFMKTTNLKFKKAEGGEQDVHDN